ncbi:MAG TPA: bifunctional oligoribonuclease/PAP phosphatase NrnA [Halanaerobiales bacterium]|nr:bifunctional oligoribonuclease/PAP phosphatase NrnA [Halanaerobiales bacterium]
MVKKNNSLQEIVEYIKENDDYLIIGHIDPDGDAIGSIMAFKFLLNHLNKNSLLLLHSDLTKEYDILFKYLNSDEYYIFNKGNEEQLKEYNKVIALDSANIERLGDYKPIIENKQIVNIDHHYDNSRFGDLNYVNPDESAVGKIIYDMVDLLDIEITEDLGTAMALAVLADTGSLKYPNSDPASFRMMASLKEEGIDIVKINRFLQSFSSLKYLKLLSEALANIKTAKQGKIAWLVVNNHTIKSIGIDEKEINNLVNYPRDIRGVEVGISFVETKKDFIDISFRSLNYVDVSKIAHKFNGGGHPRAAGTKIKGALEQTVRAVLDEVKKNV